MNKTLSSLITASLVATFGVGCSTSFDDFVDEFPGAICTWGGDCIGIDDLGPGQDEAYDCEGEVTEAVNSLNEDDACEYDAGAGDECLDLIDGAECTDEGDIYQTCQRVFTGDTCELDLLVLL